MLLFPEMQLIPPKSLRNLGELPLDYIFLIAPSGGDRAAERERSQSYALYIKAVNTQKKARPRVHTLTELYASMLRFTGSALPL